MESEKGRGEKGKGRKGKGEGEGKEKGKGERGKRAKHNYLSENYEHLSQRKWTVCTLFHISTNEEVTPQMSGSHPFLGCG